MGGGGGDSEGLLLGGELVGLFGGNGFGWGEGREDTIFGGGGCIVDDGYGCFWVGEVLLGLMAFKRKCSVGFSWDRQ